MRQTGLKQKLRAKETAFGMFINYPSPDLVEMAGLMGFDWVFIDTEHGPMGLETCSHMVRAAECVGLTSIIRLPYPDPRLINRALDTGAMGVLVPHLDSAERAREIVAGAKYYPQGERGAGHGTRAADHGFRLKGAEYAAWANEETMVFGIVEDGHALKNMPEILKVDGLTGVTIGPSDMSHSLGVPGQSNHPRVVEVVDEITRLALASDKALCRVAMSATAEEAARYIALGVPMIAVGVKNLIAQSGLDFIGKAKAAAAGRAKS